MTKLQGKTKQKYPRPISINLKGKQIGGAAITTMELTPQKPRGRKKLQNEMKRLHTSLAPLKMLTLVALALPDSQVPCPGCREWTLLGG